MLAIKHYIPNTVTLLNLLCGCMAFISVFTGQIDRVPFFIAVCLFADYFDGLLARLLKVSSPMGRELDSLADMVSFGVVPGAMLFYLINQSKGIGIEEIDFRNFETLDGLFGFLVTLFSCIRLAKFNLDARQKEGFVGLNTPACTIFVLGLLLISIRDVYGLKEYMLNGYFLYFMTIALSYFLIAEIPMFSFKFKVIEWKTNKIRILFLIFSIICLIVFKFGAALSIIILAYMIFSFVLWMAGMIKREKRDF